METRSEILRNIITCLNRKLANENSKQPKKRCPNGTTHEKRLDPTNLQVNLIIQDYYPMKISDVCKKYNTSSGKINRLVKERGLMLKSEIARSKKLARLI
jgi:hypothetical protein